MVQRNTLTVGRLLDGCALFVGCAFLVGCASPIEAETPASESAQGSLLLGEPCELSSAPQVSSRVPRVFVELAALKGDLATIQKANSRAIESNAAPRTFSQILADSRWQEVSVRHVIAQNGVQETFPWDFEPPSGQVGCPKGAGWELSMTSQVMVESSVMLRIELKILPIRPSGTSPEAWHVPTGCGALTTVVLRDQQLLVLSGFLGPESAEKRVITTLTPYVIWDDTDLDRLFECKSNRSDASQEAPPK